MNKQTITSVIVIILAAVAFYFVMKLAPAEAPMPQTGQQPLVGDLQNPFTQVGDAITPFGKLPGGSAPAPTEESIIGTKWNWYKTIMKDGIITTPKTPGVFTLTLGADGTVSGTTDCNGFGGDYTLGSDGIITFGPFMSTLMYCDGSQETEFTSDMTKVTRATLDANGNLMLMLKDNGGAIVFTRN